MNHIIRDGASEADKAMIMAEYTRIMDEFTNWTMPLIDGKTPLAIVDHERSKAYEAKGKQKIMNKPTSKQTAKPLADYGILAKYVHHETDRSRLIVPVVGNMAGGYTYKLTAKESACLDDMIADGRAMLTFISPAGAVYAVPMPERLPAMFDAFNVDPDPVTAEFVQDQMIVTIQKYYNVKQTQDLLYFVGKHCTGYNTILPVPGNLEGTITRFAVTFIDSSAYAPDTALYKRIKALAGMYAHRITPRPEVKAAKASIMLGEATITQASLF